MHVFLFTLVFVWLIGSYIGVSMLVADREYGERIDPWWGFFAWGLLQVGILLVFFLTAAIWHLTGLLAG